MKTIEEWFQSQGWKPQEFQKWAWDAYFQGKSGLICVPTGAGKTYAAFLAPLVEVLEKGKHGLQILYITPLRALARDLEIALKKPIEDLGWDLNVGMRTGDTSQQARKKQKIRQPEILLTTPESLSLMLSDADAAKQFSQMQAVLIDEWHELMGSKRGVMLQLCLARLRRWNPKLRTWAMSATMGNLEQAAQCLMPPEHPATIIAFEMQREVVIDLLLPRRVEELPWSGIFGMHMLPYLLQHLDPKYPTLIFTNTRVQAEKWHQALIESRPEWQEIIQIHHGSLSQSQREDVEEGAKSGRYRIVIATSTLDLGVDFPVLEKVVQIGSPKSVARLLQRAGRAAHRPLAPCHITLVPTHMLELAELTGIRLALEEHSIESRRPLMNCYDVLVQHIMTCGVGGGFKIKALWDEIKTAYSYKELTWEEFVWCLTFLTQGGKSLTAYPEYHKLKLDPQSEIYHVPDKKIAFFHRLNIGTISSNPLVSVQFASGKKLGAIEEDFLARLAPGDHFFFAGKILKLIQLRDLVAYVRLSQEKTRVTPTWQGGRYFPVSNILSFYLRKVFDLSEQERFHFPESKSLEQAIDIQKKLSSIPKASELLIEICKTKEGWYHFFYSFEGKSVNEGIAALIAYRLSLQQPGTFTLAANDYGFVILSKAPIYLTSESVQQLVSSQHLDEDISLSLNLTEMQRRAFRSIARIAGLIFSGYPGSQKTMRQIQASSSLIFEVFRKYDSDNLLLKQAKTEVLEEQFEKKRLEQALMRMENSKILIQDVKRLTPFALPLYVEKISSRVSSESLLQRIEKIKESWKK